MGKKIFISYKYADDQVQNIGLRYSTKVRDYVDVLQGLLDYHDHINKGENDGESLANFKDSTISSRLRNKIYDSSITIVLISPGMKEPYLDSDQWIPWEISYSLKEHTRDDRTSRSNAILAVVLPDQNGSYEYYIKEKSCPYCNCRTLSTFKLFTILKENMFNAKNPSLNSCLNHGTDSKVYTGESSYIKSVKWDDFCIDANKYINSSIAINQNIENYRIVKNLY
jgi:hypothetical protein